MRASRGRPRIPGLLLLFVLVGTASSQDAVPPEVRHPVAFAEYALSGESSDFPTTLQFGPDGRLYVGQQDGWVRVYEVSRLDDGGVSYAVVSTEHLDQIHLLPNHDDDGQPASVVGRQLTGILVAGTAENPLVFATSADPRIGGGPNGDDTGLDTNSGVLSLLVWIGHDRDDPEGYWRHVQLVRGLPRSEENHAGNGLVLDEEGGHLYWTQGGHTNMGAPSNNFTFTPEYALSAAVLRLDLNHPAIDLGELLAQAPQLPDGHVVYDLRTLDRHGDGVEDENDPFGGDDGTNQAVPTEGGPVEIYATGLRNAYDLALYGDGRLYTVDNGPNSGWGGPPVDCGNGANELDSRTYGDGLHLIADLDEGEPRAFYGGHPCPVRAGAVVGEQDPVPAELEDPRECHYLRPAGESYALPPPHDGEDDSLHVFPGSSNGLTIYTASNFAGSLAGDLLVARYGGTVDRVRLAPGGKGVLDGGVTGLFTPGGRPLDVTAQPDGAVFAGTVWVADHLTGALFVYEPVDFFECTGADDPELDEDGDGYDNADEHLSGTDPCNAASRPPDLDGDLISDRADADDDGDGVPDLEDDFARDRRNGLATGLPLDYGWALGDPGHGLLGLGFTGLMRNGVTDYLDQYDPAHLTAGGASGIFTIDRATGGTAVGGANTQENGFQLGVAVDSETGPFLVVGTMAAPWFDGEVPPPDGLSGGVFLGTGDQDHFVALQVASGNEGAHVELLLEEDGEVQANVFSVPGLLEAGSAELSLVVEPAKGTVRPQVRLGQQVVLASEEGFPLPPSVLQRILGPEAVAVGLLCSSSGAPSPAAFHYDRLRVLSLEAAASHLDDPEPGPGAGD